MNFEFEIFCRCERNLAYITNFKWKILFLSNKKLILSMDFPAWYVSHNLIQAVKFRFWEFENFWNMLLIRISWKSICNEQCIEVLLAELESLFWISKDKFRDIFDKIAERQTGRKIHSSYTLQQKTLPIKLINYIQSLYSNNEGFQKVKKSLHIDVSNWIRKYTVVSLTKTLILKQIF